MSNISINFHHKGTLSVISRKMTSLDCQTIKIIDEEKNEINLYLNPCEIEPFIENLYAAIKNAEEI
jgi:hypothetical protein